MKLFKQKNQAAISTFCWGSYMVLNGVGMILDPNGSFKLLGFEPTDEIWIRMVGLLAVVLGYYYVQAARYEFKPFYYWKVWGHLGGILIMSYFFLQNLAPANIFLICATDAVAAFWTLWGIHHNRKEINYALEV